MSSSDLEPTSQNASRAPSRRSSFLDQTTGLTAVNADPKTLVGEEIEDQEIVCNWIATSYGEVTKEYHEAYSREILRQIRAQSSPDIQRPKVPAWIVWIYLKYTINSKSQCLKITEIAAFNFSSEASYTKVPEKCQKWSILASYWKPEACGQTVLPDRSLLIGQKLVENAKIYYFAKNGAH